MSGNRSGNLCLEISLEIDLSGNWMVWKWDCLDILALGRSGSRSGNLIVWKFAFLFVFLPRTQHL